MPKQPDLDAVLHCCYIMEYCRLADREGRSNFDLGAVMGELDWHKELVRIMEEWKMATGTDEFGTPHDQTELKEDPNARQVGGEHYNKSEYQHWDFVIDNNLGYFEGQITKYVCRWRKKNGKQDLEKAAHYMEKLMQARAGNWRTGFMEKLLYPKNLSRLVSVYQLNQLEVRVCELMVTYNSQAELEQARNCISSLIEGRW